MLTMNCKRSGKFLFYFLNCKVKNNEEKIMRALSFTLNQQSAHILTSSFRVKCKSKSLLETPSYG